MRRFISHALAALVLLTLASCASASGPAGSAPADTGTGVELTRLGEAVQVTENALAVRECEFVVGLSGQRSLDDDAVRALRNAAGSQGANTVLLVMQTRTTLARAEGYLCAD